jgi:hypothetical protein
MSEKSLFSRIRIPLQVALISSSITVAGLSGASFIKAHEAHEDAIEHLTSGQPDETLFDLNEADRQETAVIVGAGMEALIGLGGLATIIVARREAEENAEAIPQPEEVTAA